MSDTSGEVQAWTPKLVQQQIAAYGSIKNERRAAAGGLFIALTIVLLAASMGPTYFDGVYEEEHARIAFYVCLFFAAIFFLVSVTSTRKWFGLRRNSPEAAKVARWHENAGEDVDLIFMRGGPSLGGAGFAEAGFEAATFSPGFSLGHPALAVFALAAGAIAEGVASVVKREERAELLLYLRTKHGGAALARLDVLDGRGSATERALTSDAKAYIESWFRKHVTELSVEPTVSLERPRGANERRPRTALKRGRHAQG